MSHPAVFKLAPGIQDYAWGKKGASSLAAQFAEVSVADFHIDDETPYAELWMGTHPNLPSTDVATSQPLSKVLADSPALMGEDVTKRFDGADKGDLPFLFKVLSIGTALSIQAHPSKPLAQRLFKERPNIYKDPNHKPEMAIALTPFLAFLNFLPLPTLLLHLVSTPELDTLIPFSLTESLASSLLLPSTRPADPFLYEPTVSPPTAAQKDLLKQIFGALMSASDDHVKEVIQRLKDRWGSGDVNESEKGVVELFKTLEGQYPGDVGVLCVFVLNVVELKRGDAAFLGADMPHAYISGDIIECMATSDNVVRAGLTPKLRDVPTLVEMLTYEAGPAAKQLLKPVPFGDDGTSLLYDPPIDEFSVVKLDLAEGASASHRAVRGPSVCVITEGSGKIGKAGEELDAKRGEVVFIGAGEEVQWTAGDKGLEVFRAYVEA